MKEDWVEVELGNVCFTTSGGTPSRRNDEYYQGSIPWVKSGELDKGIIYDTEEKISDEAVKKSSAKVFPKNTLLIALYGATIGKLAFLGVDAATNQAICGIYKSEIIESKYLYNLLLNRRQKLISQGTGGAQPNISQTILKKLPIPLAPLPIQRAIVAKIEALFSDLDKGRADLNLAKAQLKIYRQAVLKKAFEGELTKKWREQQALSGVEVPTAEELLEQIKVERQKHYELQFENWKQAIKEWEANVKEGKKPTKPKVWKEINDFTQLEINESSILPNNWKWVKLGSIFQIFIGSTPSRARSEYWLDGEINWVSSGEVAFKDIYNTKEKITKEGLENTSTTVHPKGTVMLAMIGEGKTRGQAAILKTNACHNQNTAAIRVTEIDFEPKFLFHYLFLKYERNRRVGSGNNQKALNQGRIMDFDYPLCSKQEQHQIVREIESRLSVCDKVEQSINEALLTSEALRQSILKKAFEGKLLSAAEIKRCKQEVDYEPASVLLERIKKEKKK